MHGWLQIALKCADIGHLSCPQVLHQRWTAQLRDEFFLQGDQEKQKHLAISPLMDRTEVAGLTKSQVTHPVFVISAPI